MSLHNANNPQVSIIPLGSLATDNTQIPGMYFAKKSKIVSAHIMNGAAIAASDTDFVQVGLQLTGGATVFAEIDSRAAHENGLAKNVAKALNVAEDDVPADSSLEVDYQEGGTVALTSAVLVVTHYPL
jgi:hypothetical protein